MGVFTLKKGYLYIALSTFFFSTMEISLKLVAGNFNSIQMTVSRFFVGSLVLLPFAIKHLKAIEVKLEKKDLLQFSWLGFVCIVISMILYQLAVMHTKASVVASIFSCNPIFVLFFAHLLLKANMKDHRNDCIITTFTLISVLLSIINIYWFDSVVGIGISIWICITGIKIFIESYNVLMDKAIDNTTKEEIFEIISTYKEIKGAKHFTSTPVGYQYLISISIDLDGNMSTFESHKIADSLEKKINKLPSVYLSIIHVNPV